MNKFQNNTGSDLGRTDLGGNHGSVGVGGGPSASSIVQSSCSSSSSNIMAPSSYMEEQRITLVVDNTRFVVDPSIFTQYPNTMLGR